MIDTVSKYINFFEGMMNTWFLKMSVCDCIIPGGISASQNQLIINLYYRWDTNKSEFVLTFYNENF